MMVCTLLVSLLLLGCATVSPAPAVPDRAARGGAPAFDYDASFETSCPRGIPPRFPSDLVVQLDRPGQRWSLVAEGRDCDPDLMDSMSPPFGWDQPPRRCAHVPETQLQTLHRALDDGHIDRIRVRDSHTRAAGTTILLTWRNASAWCRVHVVALTHVHRDDRASFQAAVNAIESALPAVLGATSPAVGHKTVSPPCPRASGLHAAKLEP